MDAIVKEFKKNVEEPSCLSLIIRKLRVLLSDNGNQSQLETIIKADIIGDLCDSIELDDYPELQYEAGWLLTYIASRSIKETNTMIECGAADTFIRLIETSSNYLVRRQSIWGCGVIAYGHPNDRDYLIDAEIIPPLISLLDETINKLKNKQIELKMTPEEENYNPNNVEYEELLTLLRFGVSTMSNLCRGMQPPVDYDSVKDCIPLVKRILTNFDNPEIVSDSCWCLIFLCEGLDDRIEDVLDAGIGPLLINLLRKRLTDNVVSGAMTLACMFTGTIEQLQLFINDGVLVLLKKHLSSKRKSVKLECCKTISRYVETCNVEQIQFLIEADIYPGIVELIEKGWALARNEATFVISKTTSKCDLDQINHLVEYGCIKALCSFIRNAGNKSSKLVLIALDNILKANDKQLTEGHSKENIREYKSIFKSCNGVEDLKYLKATKTNWILQKACSMLTRYFPDELDDNN